MAKTKELKVIVEVEDRASGKLPNITKSVFTANVALEGLKVASRLATSALKGFVDVAKDSVKAASKFESSMLGLESVAESFGIQATQATEAAEALTEDGLLQVTDAASGLKNLLATGFSLPQAIRLMEAFKDSAAFNRQGTLEFGEAIVGATQGIKNQNSIMVDNAGITKNLSNILIEQGFARSDLSRVTSDATVRQALYNGILKEAIIFEGDAAKATETHQGKVSQLNRSVTDLKVAIGQGLNPVLDPMIDKITIATGEAGELVTEFINTFDASGELKELLEELTDETLTLLIEVLGDTLQWVKDNEEGFKNLAEAVISVVNAVEWLLDLLGESPKSIGEAKEITIEKTKKHFLEAALMKVGLPQELADIVEDIGGFRHGGVIPGGFNQPVPAILHGGERVIPRTGTDVNETTRDVSINFNNVNVRSDNDLDAIIRAVKGAIDRENALFAQGAL